MSETEPLVRPVKCYFCDKHMHYSGHHEHEPEVEITVASRDDESTFYAHIRCWNALIEQLAPPTESADEAEILAQLSKTPAEAYESGYADGYKRASEKPKTLRQRFAAWRERTGFFMDGRDGGM